MWRARDPVKLAVALSEARHKRLHGVCAVHAGGIASECRLPRPGDSPDLPGAGPEVAGSQACVYVLSVEARGI